jgi:hypothetical protein
MFSRLVSLFATRNARIIVQPHSITDEFDQVPLGGDRYHTASGLGRQGDPDPFRYEEDGSCVCS